MPKWYAWTVANLRLPATDLELDDQRHGSNILLLLGSRILYRKCNGWRHKSGEQHDRGYLRWLTMIGFFRVVGHSKAKSAEFYIYASSW